MGVGHDGGFSTRSPSLVHVGLCKMPSSPQLHEANVPLDTQSLQKTTSLPWDLSLMFLPLILVIFWDSG